MFRMIAPYLIQNAFCFFFITEGGGNLGEKMQKEILENGRTRQKKFMGIPAAGSLKKKSWT
jgi:hypothetical protein